MSLPLTRRLAGREVGAFRLCGCAGLAAASAVATALALARGLSAEVELALIAAAVATFLALALVTRRLLGREALIYYHHEIAVLSVTATLAAVLGAPVLGHLDATALGLGAFLACGRIGCLHVGCCHGRPARRGVLYGPAHAGAGFPGYLVGLRLLPVQALEASGVLAVAAVGGALVAGGAPAGAGFAVYVSGYALLRFGTELARGDTGRRWWRGLSEAQWTSVALAGAVAGLAVAGALPGPALPHVALAAVLLVGAGLQLAGLVGRPRGVLDPRHVEELATALRAAEHPPRGVPVVVMTSLGVRVSHGVGGAREHWSLSGTSPGAARALGRAILWLRRPDADAEVVAGPEGLLHVVVR